MAADWQVNMLRFTLFPVGEVPSSVDTWRPLLGSAPESEEARPREGVHRQSGPYRNGRLEITLSPGRLDIAIAPRPPEMPHASPFGGFQAPTLPRLVVGAGSFMEELSAAAEMVLHWLPQCPFRVQRMAVAGMALAHVASATAAYELMSEQIKTFKVVPDQMKELVFKINWRVKADEDLGYINRLTGWNAVTFNFGLPMLGSQAVINENFVSLEFDVNTPGERTTPLAEADLVSTLERLVALSVESLESGECPTTL